MWTAIIRGVVGMAALTFMMTVLGWVLTPILSFANSGPQSDAASVQRVGGYFAALTQNNLILLAGLAVGIFLISRAAVELKLGG